MRPVVLYIAMSLDGYIASEDGGVDWLGGHDSDTPETELMAGYSDFLGTVGTLIMGRATYDQILAFGQWPYSGKQAFVFTDRDAETDPNVEFVQGDPASLIDRLRTAEGGAIWLVGGANLVRQFSKADLIDEWRITVIPQLLGNGISLFEKGSSEHKLRLIDTREIAGTIELHYSRR